MAFGPAVTADSFAGSPWGAAIQAYGESWIAGGIGVELLQNRERSCAVGCVGRPAFQQSAVHIFALGKNDDERKVCGTLMNDRANADGRGEHTVASPFAGAMQKQDHR